jgi:Peptidase family M23
MPLRHGIRGLVASVLLLALGAAGAGAATHDLTTTVAGNAATTTVPLPVTTTTLAPTTTTAAVATTPAPTTTAPATTVAVQPAARPARISRTGPALATCRGLAGLAVLRPNGRPLVVEPAQPARTPAVAGGALLYPADGAVVRAGSRASASSCSVSLRELSLFGGAIEADSATIGAQDGRLVPSVEGLRVRGRRVRPKPGAVVHVGQWALLGSLPVLACAPSSRGEGAIAVHLLRPRAGLPAGTTLVLAYAELVAKTAPAPSVLCAGVHETLLQREERLHLPLSITPPLGRHLKYVFPLASAVGVGDTYGALRSDVPGGWHHGDDIFAPIGTPVVAVASGTLNRIGWNRAGGWRLWVRDDVGDQFYYAHLSGYTPLALSRGRVEAGDVVGFVGDSGDAMMTPPHLHFEVHPRRLLFLHYDGAVDPTTYLRAWPHVAAGSAPRPVLPKLPRGPARAEAKALYRKLLVLRGFTTKSAPAKGGRPALRLTPREPTDPVVRASAPLPQASAASSSSSRLGWLLGGPLGAGVLGLMAALAVLRVRRRPEPAPVVAVPEPDPPRPLLRPAGAPRGSAAHALIRIGIVMLASSTAMSAIRASRGPSGRARDGVDRADGALLEAAGSPGMADLPADQLLDGTEGDR